MKTLAQGFTKSPNIRPNDSLICNLRYFFASGPASYHSVLLHGTCRIQQRNQQHSPNITCCTSYYAAGFHCASFQPHLPPPNCQHCSYHNITQDIEYHHHCGQRAERVSYRMLAIDCSLDHVCWCGDFGRFICSAGRDGCDELRANSGGS